MNLEPKFRGSMPRIYRTLKIKKEIIKEAYSSPNNVKATARKYEIQRFLICRWKRHITADEAAMALTLILLQH